MCFANLAKDQPQTLFNSRFANTARYRYHLSGHAVARSLTEPLQRVLSICNTQKVRLIYTVNVIKLGIGGNNRNSRAVFKCVGNIIMPIQTVTANGNKYVAMR